jgi:hypothetical protein
VHVLGRYVDAIGGGGGGAGASAAEVELGGISATLGAGADAVSEDEPAVDFGEPHDASSKNVPVAARMDDLMADPYLRGARSVRLLSARRRTVTLDARAAGAHRTIGVSMSRLPAAARHVAFLCALSACGASARESPPTVAPPSWNEPPRPDGELAAAAVFTPSAAPLGAAVPSPTGTSTVYSTHRDAEQDLAAITGGTVATQSPTGDPGDPGEVVSRMQPSFRECFEKALKTDPKAGGSVKLEAVLLPSGLVASVAPEENAGLSPSIVSCTSAVVAKARFRPVTDGSETHIEIPVRFRPTR